MFRVTVNKNRSKNDGQIFVELTSYIDISDFSKVNRLGYYCDKLHLEHFLTELTKVFTKDEINEIIEKYYNE